MNPALIQPTATLFVTVLETTFGGRASIVPRNDGTGAVDVVPDATMSKNIREQAISFFKKPGQIGLSTWPIIRPYIVAAGGVFAAVILAALLASLVSSMSKGGSK